MQNSSVCIQYLQWSFLSEFQLSSPYPSLWPFPKDQLNLFVTPEIPEIRIFSFSWTSISWTPAIHTYSTPRFTLLIKEKTISWIAIHTFPLLHRKSPFLGFNKQNRFSLLREDGMPRYYQNWKLNTFPIMVLVHTNCIWNCLIISTCKFTISRWHASLGEELQNDNAYTYLESSLSRTLSIQNSTIPHLHSHTTSRNP